MANSPRILIAAGIYPPDSGGPAIHAQAQYEWFKKKGLEVRLVVLAHYRKFPKGIRHLLYFIKLIMNVRFCDVVYAHDAVGVGIPALLAARMFNKKLVIRVGGDISWEREAEQGITDLSMFEWYKDKRYAKNNLYKLSSYTLSKTDKIIVPSKILSDIYVIYYAVPESKIVIIPNPTPEKINVQENSNNTIVYASRLVLYKNLNFVLRVFVKIFLKHPELKFVIMGDGPERKNLEKMAKELNINDKVIFKGSVSQSEVLDNTSKCLFTLAPALTEFNPNYVLQSISYKKPFLISRENGLPFFVPEDLVFDPRDELDLENKVLNLINPVVYEKSREFVSNLSNISWEDNLEANLKVLQ